jgi:predicted nucleic acid-binding protein
VSPEATGLIVVDASVAAKWYLPEELSGEAEKVLEAGVRGGVKLCAPGLLAAELGNVFWHRYRRGELTLDAVRRAWAAFEAAPVAVFETKTLVPPALEIAVACGCTVYDALYVALAEADEAAVVLTADRRLCDWLSGTPFSGSVRLLGARSG